MSVGKESILRAANAGVKKAAEAVKPAEITEAAEAAKPAAKPETKNAAAKTTKSVKTAKTTKTTKTTARKKTVKKSVISTPNAEVLEAAFVTEDKKEPVNGPVHINEDLPVYLL